ncbi:hypothetical protein TNCV_1782421 [Trichonephila clavipes]|nr:hypothetical protein TNCV_1782421 [Trichonephila clavipes]
MVRKKKRASYPRKNIALTAKEIESSSSPNKISESHTSKMETMNDIKIKQEENLDADEEKLQQPINIIKNDIRFEDLQTFFQNITWKYPSKHSLEILKVRAIPSIYHRNRKILFIIKVKEIESRINMEQEAEKYYIIRGLKENRVIEIQLQSCSNIEELEEKMKLLDIQEKSKSSKNEVIYPKYPMTRIPYHTNQFAHRQQYGGWNWRNDQSQHPDTITNTRYKGRINFKQVDVLLDTGSSVNIIPKKNIISQVKGYHNVEYIKTKIATINGEIEVNASKAAISCILKQQNPMEINIRLHSTRDD